MIRDFWWGTEKGQSKAHWIAWDKLLRSKDQGGLGFKDLHCSIKRYWPGRLGG
jgi:hypothetical protein